MRRRPANGVVIHLVADGSVENAVELHAGRSAAPGGRPGGHEERRAEGRRSRSAPAACSACASARTTTRCASWSTAMRGGDPFDGRRVMPVRDRSGDRARRGRRGRAGAGGRLRADAVGRARVEQRDRDGRLRLADARRPRTQPMAPHTAAIASIQSVEFDSQPERDRVVVHGEQPVDYLVYEPDPGDGGASITGATLAPEAAVRIAPEAAGPVSLITAFEQPDVKTPEVRVVMKRAAEPEAGRDARGRDADASTSRTPVEATPAAGAGDGRRRRRRAPSAAMPGRWRRSAPRVADPGATQRQRDARARRDRARCAGPRARRLGSPGRRWIRRPSIEILNEGGLMDGKEYVGRRISLDFKEVEIADVLRLIAEVSDLNVIAGDEVKGKVTIRLVDVPWDQALDVILLTKGLGFARIGNVLRIAATDVLAQEEELRLQERRAKEKLEDLVVKLQPVNYANVDEVAKHGEAAADGARLGQHRQAHQHADHQGHPVGDRRGDRADQGGRHDDAAGDDRGEDRRGRASTSRASSARSGASAPTRSPSPRSAVATTCSRRAPTTTSPRASATRSSLGNPITAAPTGLLNLAATVLDEKFNYELQLQAAEVERRRQGDLEPARRHRSTTARRDRAGRVDPVPDLRERRCPARVRGRRAEAQGDAAHHGGPEHHHEDRGEPERAGRQRRSR